MKPQTSKFRNVSDGRNLWKGFTWEVNMTITERMVVDEIEMTALYRSPAGDCFQSTLTIDVGPFDAVGELLQALVIDTGANVLDKRVTGVQGELPFDPFTA